MKILFIIGPGASGKTELVNFVRSYCSNKVPIIDGEMSFKDALNKHSKDDFMVFTGRDLPDKQDIPSDAEVRVLRTERW